MQYVWLIWSLAFLIPWFRPGFRRQMLRVSLATSLLGLSEPVFVPAYWNPPTLFDLAQRTGFDIESLIFCFAIGGICGCCEKYVDYLRENGFAVKAIDETDMSAMKKRYGMTHAASCHTTLIDGYVVEGHVPVGAIRKLLKEKPAIVGISAPGMPQNSPGMGEMKKGTLTIYAVPKGRREPEVFSVE